MRFSVWCDRLVLGGLVALIVLTPLAFGGVHSATRGALAVAVFALGLVAIAKVAIAGSPADGWPQLPWTIWLPVGALVVLGGLQVTPLPPSVLGVLSPTAFSVYQHSLPGWPEHLPYADIQGTTEPGEVGARWHVLPTPAEVGVGNAALLQFDGDTREALEQRVAGAVRPRFQRAWRPLSLAPGATRSALLMVVCYVVVFLLVVLYPWDGGRAGERQAERTLLRALLFTVVGIAAIGLLQRLAWNGRILWFFVPFDWQGIPDPRPRTSGPFINRNHFAGYLALFFPMLLAGVLTTTRLDAVRRHGPRWLPYLVGTVVVALASLLSLSRGGWAALLAGTVGLLLVWRPALQWSLPSWRPLVLGGALVALACTIILPPVAVGIRGGARDVDARLAQTLGDSASWDARIAMWRGALAMARDSPLIGVGLGAWGDAYPRYDEDSYDGITPRAAHNDYLELLAELGLLGLLLVGISLTGVVRRIRSSVEQRSARGRPLAVGVLAGVIAVAVHELVEFNLQIPAIALSFSIMLAVTLRPALPRSLPGAAGPPRAAAVAVGALVAGLVALFLPAASPASNGLPDTVAAALARIDAWPARARHHYDLARLVSSETRQRELEIARWLAPRDPRPRDALAALRNAAGDRAGALRAIERSMEVDPGRERHPYLTDQLLPWLAADEVEAVERGLARAIARDVPVASWTLATIQRVRGRSAAAAATLEEAARRARTHAERYALLLAAGIDRVRADDPDGAARALGEASRLRPSATAPYVWLIASVRSTDGGLAEGHAIADRGVARGADAAELWFAVAAAAKRATRPREQRAALERTLARRPALAKAHFELGILLLEEGRAGRAVLSLRRATERAPTAVGYWYHLARAARASHDLGAARRALERVLALAPGHQKARALLVSIASLPR